MTEAMKQTMKKLVWQCDISTGEYFLIDYTTKNKRILAVVTSDAAWRTLDMDGAGGESGQELLVGHAQQEAEQSLRELGYL
jgi:hypothetical protein